MRLIIKLVVVRKGFMMSSVEKEEDAGKVKWEKSKSINYVFLGEAIQDGGWYCFFGFFFFFLALLGQKLTWRGGHVSHSVSVGIGWVDIGGVSHDSPPHSGNRRKRNRFHVFTIVTI